MSKAATYAAGRGESNRSATPSDAALGRKLRELRRARDLTQKDLAAAVGITGAQLHRYEMGTTRVAASRVVALAEALGVQPDSLISFCKAPPARRDAGAERMPGVSLRDWFAGQALAGLCAHRNSEDYATYSLAEVAFNYADSMLVARAREPGA